MEKSVPDLASDPQTNALDAPLDATLTTITDARLGAIALWSDADAPSGCPLLLIHSVNAAASAYEVRPLFQHYRGQRPVFAMELPGFGHSERSDRSYTVRLMTDAVLEAAKAIQTRTGAPAIDAMALSLGCEFLARAAAEARGAFRTLGMVSPTGFETISPVAIMRHPHPQMHRLLNASVWSAGLFRLMMRRWVIRKFLEKTWGSRTINESLLNYDCRIALQEGAQHAPYYFISGYLFSADILEIYRSLTLPVWVGHGTRGDFVDYPRLQQMDPTNWSVTVFDSGAFPQFETLEALVTSYERFQTCARDASTLVK